MPLVSKLFRDNRRLQACLLDHSAHVTPGSKGQHVALIQYAVLKLGGGSIAGYEINHRIYGKTTTEVVLGYKKSRRIINLSYQTSEDNIVGRMTIAALDREMALDEQAEAANFFMPFMDQGRGR